jgi:hypothetical protein
MHYIPNWTHYNYKILQANGLSVLIQFEKMSKQVLVTPNYNLTP